MPSLNAVFMALRATLADVNPEGFTDQSCARRNTQSDPYYHHCTPVVGVQRSFGVTILACEAVSWHTAALEQPGGRLISEPQGGSARAGHHGLTRASSPGPQS